MLMNRRVRDSRLMCVAWILVKGMYGMSMFKLASVAAFASVIASGVWATPVSLQYNGAAAGGYETVYLDALPGVIVGANASGNRNVSAGGFDMNDTSGLLGSSFVAWCLDLGSYLGQSGVHGYETTTNPFTNSVNLAGAAMARVKAVFNANFDNTINASTVSSAGFQVALWEAVYEGYDVTSGDFQASGNAGVVAAATGYLNAAMAYTGGNNWNFTFLQSTAASRRQNLVTVSPVPVPAAGLMLLTALGGLVAARRRKKAA
jgi:hypothetical protein